MNRSIGRREFLALLGASAAAPFSTACGGEDDPNRYTADDIAALAAQRTSEAQRSGTGPFGPQRYRGYRGLAELPWYEVDPAGVLRCVDESVPRAIDMHCHFGISVMFAPEIDLHSSPPRVQHLLDCDGPEAGEAGCDLDLDVYINANFTEENLGDLQLGTVAQGLWGSSAAATQTIPNLLAEMDAVRIERATILPITLGLPFGDDLSERWLRAIDESRAPERLIKGGSVHPRDDDRIARLERYAAAGARIIKLHPTMQRFYPDDPSMNEIYEACDRLGLAVFFHCGRAGIEPEATHRYALPRHYEAPLADFPNVQFVLGHGGARDHEAALELAPRYENAWLGIHGQGVSWLGEMIKRTGGERLLFGTDWPFYHLAATQAKVLLATEGEPELRHAILRGNAERLLGA